MSVNPRRWPDELALVESPRRQPDANTVVHENLHAIGPAVGKQIGVVGVCRAEYLHHPSQRGIGSGTHIQWLHRQPGTIDSDHLRIAVDQRAKSLAADMGHVTVIFNAPLRTST